MLRASASSIEFTSIYGSPPKLSPTAAPYAYFLSIDGVGLLLDCGWDESFDTSYLCRLLPYVRRADAVLLSTPEVRSCGALPFVLEHLPSHAFVAAAGSTAKLGLHALLHAFLYQFSNTCTFTLHDAATTVGAADDGGVVRGDEAQLPGSYTLTVDGIYSAFRNVREPYGGKVTVQQRGVALDCVSTFAGRMLGGYAWSIRYQIDEIFYCPDFSLKPSYALKRFVAPTTANIVLLASFAARPDGGGDRTSSSAAGDDATQAHSTALSGRKYDEQLQALFRHIQHTLRGGNDVLLPVTVAGRGLEVVNIVCHLLRERGGDKYKVVLAALQAQELMSKAMTATEVLQDDIILAERSLFAGVLPCRSAQEVLEIAGPKVCIADGAALDFGIAAELLEYFIAAHPGGGENLVVLTEPPAEGSNAYHLLHTPPHAPLTYTTVARTRLSKEELEAYYVELEIEAEQKRRHLEEDGTFTLETEKSAEVVGDDGDGDEVNDGAALAARRGDGHGDAAVTRNTPGLTLPSYIHFQSRFLHFPILDATHTLHAAAMAGEDVSYGLPVSDEEQYVLQRRAPARVQSDEGPEAPSVSNDAQREANLPAKINTVTHHSTRDCKVLFCDLTGVGDVVAVRGLLRSRFTFARKLVVLRGRVEGWRPIAQFCRNDEAMQCRDSVFLPTSCDVPLELATRVYSYTVQLDSRLVHMLPRAMRRVRGSANAEGSWEVGWVDGELRTRYKVDSVEDVLAPDLQRVRTEDRVGDEAEHSRRQDERHDVLTMAAPRGGQLQACARFNDTHGLQRGSFYLGNMDLTRLRDAARHEDGLLSDFHRKAPMLVFDDGICVRKGTGGTVTLSSIASPTVFEVRQLLYKQYEQVL